MDIYHALEKETKENTEVTNYLQTLEQDVTMLKLRKYDNKLSYDIQSIWEICKNKRPSILLKEVTGENSAWKLTRRERKYFMEPNVIAEH